MIIYPPGTSEDDFAKIPARYREDAVQEAWVASLEGGDPIDAAKKYAKHEEWHEYTVPLLGKMK